MKEYHKIQSLYKRDEKTHKFKIGEFSCPEFHYLYNNEWGFTEKVDGTNIRIEWDGTTIKFGGRTDNAQIPSFLYNHLIDLFPLTKFAEFDSSIILYGEGYGAKIQKGGGNYKADGVSFVLFDAFIEGWWLRRTSLMDIASKLQIELIPVCNTGTLNEAEKLVQKGFKSNWGDFTAEGLVCRPIIELQNRAGERIITKLKTKDYE